MDTKSEWRGRRIKWKMGWFNQPAYFMDDLITLVTKEALRLKLDPALAAAIVEQESNWDPWAIRYETAFYAKYVAPNILKEKMDFTEAHARAMSWGLMQMMGEDAREVGFDGKYLSELLDPQTNAGVGCYIFNNELKRANGDITQALLFWNGGGNPQYATQVLGRIGKYKVNGASK